MALRLLVACVLLVQASAYVGARQEEQAPPSFESLAELEDSEPSTPVDYGPNGYVGAGMRFAEGPATVGDGPTTTAAKVLSQLERNTTTADEDLAAKGAIANVEAVLDHGTATSLLEHVPLPAREKQNIEEMRPGFAPRGRIDCQPGYSVRQRDRLGAYLARQPTLIQALLCSAQGRTGPLQGGRRSHRRRQLRGPGLPA